MTDKNTTVYAVEFQGGDAVVAGFSEVGKAASGAAGEASMGFRSHLDKIGNAFASIKRDVDVFGGSAASAFANAADDAVAMVGAIGSGGVLGAISALTIGIGLLKTAWNAQENAAKLAAQQAAQTLEDEKKHLDVVVAAYKKTRDDMSRSVQEEARLRNNARAAELEQVKRDEAANRIAAIYTNRADRQRLADLDKEFADLQKKNKRLLAEQDREITLYYEREKVLARREALEAEAAESQENANRITAIERKAAQTLAAERAANAKQEDKRISAYWTSWEKRKQADRDGVTAMITALDLAAAAEQQFLGEFNKGFVTWEQHTAAVDKEGDAERKRADAVAKAEDADRKHREELQAKSDAIDADTQATLYSASVNGGYEASMYLIGNATSFATNELRKFADINRDNYREMLEFTPKARDALVARAQAAIFAMGLEAGTKSIFETGEAIRETAMAFGMLAIPGMQGQAAMHFVSAGTHLAAASAYATIGGSAVGGSLAIGATRGKGGLFGTGADAATGVSGGAASPSGQGGTSGPVAGRSAGGSQSAGPVVVNFIYEAGSMNSGDTQRLGRGVARGVRAANRDGFARRQMRQ